MCRDQNRDIRCFNKYITKALSRIEKFQFWISSRKIPDERVPIVLRSIGSTKLRLLIAMYSAGNPISNIKRQYLELLNTFDQYWQAGHVLMKHEDRELKQYLDYYDMLWMLSLGYLFDVPNKEFRLLADLIDRDKVVDRLYELILSSKLEGRIPADEESYEFGWSLYKSLREAIKKDLSDEIRIELISKYLKKEWEEDHQEIMKSVKSRNETYFGAWSFESAAVVVIFDVNDSRFRENQYYPNDLVDHCRELNKNN